MNKNYNAGTRRCAFHSLCTNEQTCRVLVITSRRNTIHTIARTHTRIIFANSRTCGTQHAHMNPVHQQPNSTRQRAAAPTQNHIVMAHEGHDSAKMWSMSLCAVRTDYGFRQPQNGFQLFVCAINVPANANSCASADSRQSCFVTLSNHNRWRRYWVN